ncbi:actin-related protein 8 isoform X2 [Andrographis paniculata]|uniref:actin-related protein 8 isoform X2 n=1 Tax=Andrographis paniculata TaxID=175694 RepID=UPI0021E8E53A|nr:actin-related protein 8 isoform X2 [Andrographis paniculata]
MDRSRGTPSSSPRLTCESVILFRYFLLRCTTYHLCMFMVNAWKFPELLLLMGVLGIANTDGASIPVHQGGPQRFWNLETLSLQCIQDLGISFQQFAAACRMRVKPSTQPIVVSTPLAHYDDNENAERSRRQLEDAICSTLFEMNVPAVCAINQATLALFSARRTSGIVVNIGFHQTSVVPILHGKVMYKVGVEVVGMGAMKLTSFLRDQMQQNNIHFDSLYTVRTLKEKLCYVALDYEAELSKDTVASFAVTSDNWFTLTKERFQTGEILFRPRMAGVQAMGLQQAVGLCMDHCHDAELKGDDNWYKTVVLAGGTACLPGLAARLEKELRELLPLSISNGIRVIPPPYGTDSAWFGAKLVSNLSAFPTSWCITKKQFRHQSKGKFLSF